ncbi:hydrogenase maturation protease [bacterium]|nr:hydrogenase maturation protease [bacterium]
MKTLVLGLGNDLIADDGVGIEAARQLRVLLADAPDVEVHECSLCGIALLEELMDYDRVILIDAVKTGAVPVGEITKLRLEDLGVVLAPSPHYAGLPELLALANELQLDFPKEFIIYSIEVEDPYTIGGSMTDGIQRALPRLVERVQNKIMEWNCMPATA